MRVTSTDRLRFWTAVFGLATAVIGCSVVVNGLIESRRGGNVVVSAPDTMEDATRRVSPSNTTASRSGEGSIRPAIYVMPTSTVAQSPSTTCAIPGPGWSPYGSGAWTSDGSTTFNCLVPNGFVVDTASGRVGAGTVLNTSGATAYRTGGASGSSALRAPQGPSGSPCIIPGSGWTSYGPNGWLSDGSVVFNCIIPNGYVIDTAAGRLGAGAVLATSAATAYRVG